MLLKFRHHNTCASTSVVIFQYAGHGATTLHHCDDGRHSRYYSDRAFFSEIDRGSFLLRDDSEVDVVFAAIPSWRQGQSINSPGRIVEVLAAVDAKSKTANIPGQRVF